MIHRGDLFDVLPTLPEASVDACVTDPPYGIGFMGREWDTFKPEAGQKRIVPNRQIASDNPNLKGRTRGPASSPSAVEYDRTPKGQREFQDWCQKWAAEVFRALKPGAHLLICGAPRSFHRMACGVEDAGFEIRDCLSWLYGQGFPKSFNVGEGRGTALKPAWEPIVLARKPFKGSVKANVLEHGTAALNVDACRINMSEDEKEVVDSRSGRGFGTGNSSLVGIGRAEGKFQSHDLGRWPSNVLLDEEAAAMLDEQSGELGIAGNVHGDVRQHGGGCFAGGQISASMVYKDRGGASRFFYVAKPSREERNTGTERNIHPTVKPVELMRWLVKLVTPVGGTVLDPFTGSGTTGMACAYELRPFIGIEREAEYVAIAERRIAACVPLFSGERTA